MTLAPRYWLDGPAGQWRAVGRDPQPAVPGWRDPLIQPYGADSFWNVAVGADATFGDGSHPWVATTGTITWNGAPNTPVGGLAAASAGSVNGTYYTTPVWVGAESDPLGSFILQANQEQPDGPTVQLHVPPDGVLAADYALASPDSFLAVIEPDGDTVHELYKVMPVASTPLTWTARRYITYSLRGSGSDGVNLVGAAAGVRASLCSLLGGLIRSTELDSTDDPRVRIPHALSMALRLTQQQQIDPAAGKVGYIWPARGRDYNAATVGNAQYYWGAVPLGARFAIPPSVDVTTLGLSDTGLALAYAMQDYGVVDTDSASGPTLYAEVASTPARVAEATTAWRALYPLLRPVTNASQAAPGGPGSPRRPAAFPLIPLP